jgi:hypothetical protein
MRKRAWRIVVGAVCLALGAAAATAWLLHEPAPEVIDVYPGDDLQAALESAAARPVKPTIRLHEGVYRPAAPGEALLAFNARHDGVVVEGVGAVVLTAANPDVADPAADSFPAVVSHVVYFGDGVSERTVLRHLRLTGARGFVRAPPDFRPVRSADELGRADHYLARDSAIEANRDLPKTHYFYTDGGGILIYGRSYPTVEGVEISGNYSTLCAGGVSVQHRLAAMAEAAHFRRCVFRDNHCAASGAAVDLLLPGSWAVFEDCLFVGNVSDEKIVRPELTRFGVLSVFPHCRAEVRRCTFTDNGSGVDDRGSSAYENVLFWRNTRPGGVNPGPAFDVNIVDAAGVENCWIEGPAGDLRASVSQARNRFDARDPAFDADFRPHNPLYEGAGYRP